MLSFNTDSTAKDITLCKLLPTYFNISFHIIDMTSFELNLSNIPSLPNTIKSCSLVILNYLISGSAMTTFGLPPNYSNFASISPNVRHTDNLPGFTLTGPNILCPSSFKPCV